MANAGWQEVVAEVMQEVVVEAGFVAEATSVTVDDPALEVAPSSEAEPEAEEVDVADVCGVNLLITRSSLLDNTYPPISRRAKALSRNSRTIEAHGT